MEKGTSWQGVYTLMEDFPELTCILCDIGIHGVDRYTWPLLETYKNLYLETSLLALGYGQMEATVKKFGAERILFGSGFPVQDCKSAVESLYHLNNLARDSVLPVVPREHIRGIIERDSLKLLGLKRPG